MQGREECLGGRASDLRRYTGEDPSVDVTFASAISPTSAQVLDPYMSRCQVVKVKHEKPPNHSSQSSNAV